MKRNALVGVTAVLMLVVTALWWAFLYSPQRASVAAANDRLLASEQVNDELELTLARLQDTQRRSPELTADLEQLRTAVPDEASLGQFLLDANDVATQSGVLFTSVSPTLPAVNGTDPLLPAVVSMSIIVGGGYHETLDYLNRLAAMRRLLIVDSISVSPGEDPLTSAPLLYVSLTARIFTTAIPAGTLPLVVPTPPTTVAPEGSTPTTVPTPEATTT